MSATAPKWDLPDELFPSEEKTEATAILRGFLGEPKTKKTRRGTISDSQWGRMRDAVDAYMQLGDWANATPRDFVVLYAILHERVYGVAASELTPAERLHAAGAAARMLAREFAGDPNEMAEFMRWAWQREAVREKWRRDNNRDGGRIGWRLMFNGSLLTDWRLERTRRHARSR